MSDQLVEVGKVSSEHVFKMPDKSQGEISLAMGKANAVWLFQGNLQLLSQIGQVTTTGFVFVSCNWPE